MQTNTGTQLRTIILIKNIIHKIIKLSLDKVLSYQKYFKNSILTFI